MITRTPHFNPGLPMDDESRFVYRSHNPDRVRSGPTVPAGQKSLANNLTLWEVALDSERNPDLRKELKDKVKKGNAYLERLNKSIQSPKDLDNALNEWDQLSGLLANLDASDTTYLAMIRVLDSDFSAFLDKNTLAQVEIARARIAKSDQYGDVLKTVTPDQIKASATEAWEQTVKTDLPKLVAGLSEEDAREWYTKKLQEEGVESTRDAWVSKNLDRTERAKRKALGHSDLIPHDAVNTLKSLALEARSILQDQMAEHLKKKVDSVEAELEKLVKKWGNELSQDTESDVRAQIDSARGFIESDIRHFNPDDLSPVPAREKLKELIAETESEAKESIQAMQKLAEDLDEYSQHPTETVQLMKKREARIFDFMRKAEAPETVQAAKASLELQRKESTLSDPDLREVQCAKGMKMIQEDLENPNAEWKTFIREPLPIDGLSGEEIVERATRLRQISTPFENKEKSQMARKAMEIIQQPGTPRQILERLSQTVGAEHVKQVSSATFEEKYRRYTMTGSMVFYKRGDFWKIIVDESKIDDPSMANSLKDDINHELRHLEFESNPLISGPWKDAFTRQLSQDDWRSIKDAFANHYPEKTPSTYKGKLTRFTGDLWPDDDLLSELYAMEPEWSFLPEVAQKARRVIHFKLDSQVRGKLEAALLGPENADKWIQIREKMVTAFPKRVNADGLTIREWEDSDVLAELYALLPTDREVNLDDSEELGQFFGAEGKGKKGEDEIVIKEEDLSKDDLDRKLGSIIKDIEKAYEKSPYLSSISGAADALAQMKQTAKDMRKKLPALLEQKNLMEAHNTIDKLHEALEVGPSSLNGRLREISETAGNPRTNPLSSIYDSVSLYSLSDFKAIYDQVVDYSKRYFERVAGVHKGNLGKIIFNGISKGLKLDASSYVSGAWKKVVGDWKDRVKSKNTSKLWGFLRDQAKYDLPDKGIVCATIETLCEKGAMDWKNKYFLACLHHLQRETPLDPVADPMLLEDENYLFEKLKIAMASPPAFNKESAFNDWNKTNTSAFDERKSKAAPVINSSIRFIGSRLKKLLEDKKLQQADKLPSDKPIDGAEYEEMLDLSIENGFSEPEEAMFFLWSGMAVGLLKPNSGTKLARHFGIFPVMDYFNDMSAELTTTEKIKEFVAGKDGKSGKFGKDFANNAPGEDFRRFYWTEMLNNARVRTRAQQKVPTGGDGWDHDWSKSFAMCGNATIAKSILAGRGPQPLTQLTKLPNIYAGVLQFFEQNTDANLKQPPNHKILVDAIGYYFMWESILCGAAYSKEPSYRRGSSVDRSEKPHAGGPAKHPNFNMGDCQDSLNNLMTRIDPKLGRLFSLSTNTTGDLDNIKSTLLTLMPGEESFIKGLKTVDNFYDNLQNIINKLLAGVPTGTLVTAIRSGLPK